MEGMRATVSGNRDGRPDKNMSRGCNRRAILLGSGALIGRAAIAQLVRALDCGSRGRPFEPGWRYQ
jgi:hypothetical protein